MTGDPATAHDDLADDTRAASGLRDVWDRDHDYLVGLATRMLADRAEAEDVVQEAFTALADMPAGEIREPRAWLAVVVRRRCLNRLRSAYRRRETPTDGGRAADGEWTGALGALGPVGRAATEQVATDPADRLSLDEKVRVAMAVLVDRLSPAERTSFLLHDVFGFPFEAIAEMVGRTPAACRQLASRGRRGLQGGDLLADGAASPTAVGVADLVTERFIAACAGGDLDALLAVLDRDAVGHATLVGTGIEVHAESAAEIAPVRPRPLRPGRRPPPAAPRRGGSAGDRGDRARRQPGRRALRPGRGSHQRDAGPGPRVRGAAGAGQRVPPTPDVNGPAAGRWASAALWARVGCRLALLP